MIFIFGWGHRTIKNIGPLSEEETGHHNENQFWELKRIREWFTFLFIPIIPVKTIYQLVSTATGLVIPLTREEYSRMKPLADLNLKAALNQISREDYEMLRTRLVSL